MVNPGKEVHLASVELMGLLEWEEKLVELDFMEGLEQMVYLVFTDRKGRKVHTVVLGSQADQDELVTSEASDQKEKMD